MQTHSVSFTGKAYNSKQNETKIKAGSCSCASCNGQNNNKKVAAAAILGSTLPIIAINLACALKKGKIGDLATNFKNLPLKGKLKSALKMVEIDNLGKIFATSAGGIMAGTLVGAKGKHSKNEKQAIYKEGVFQFLNSMVPASFVSLSLLGLKKAGKSNSKGIKAAAILGSLVAGMFVANKASDKINNKVFENTQRDNKKRGFKAKDIISQLDDLAYVAVLTKVPFASKFHIDKVLPLIYAKMGYEAGSANKEK